MREQKPCIFCGLHGNKSKEHFYPNWLGEFIQAKDVHNTATTLTQRAFFPRVLTNQSRRQGHLITKKLRVVCESCNNGWMSNIESAVKPLLVAGILNRDVSLSPEQQRELAEWACLKTIVCEHSDSKLALTPFEDRRRFYADRLIPGYFRIYLGAHSTSSVTWMRRHSATISFSKSVQPPLLDGLQRNIQIFTFILGRLLFHVLAARVDQIGLDADITYPGLARVWPIGSDEIRTDTLRNLSAPEIGQLLESLEDYIRLQKPTFTDTIV